MTQPHGRGIRWLTIALSLAAACGGGGGRDADTESPRDSPVVPGLPIHSVEAPQEAGLTRQYYEGAVQSEGDATRGEIPREIRLLLATVEDAAGTPRSYELTEYQIEYDVAHRLVSTKRSSGSLTVSTSSAGETLYTLQAGAAADPPRTFTKIGPSLYVPTKPGAPAGIMDKALLPVARAARGVIEIGDGLEQYPHWRFRLPLGDALVARLRPAPGNAWALVKESTGPVLRYDGTSSANDRQVFSLKAVARGETELTFRHVDGKDQTTEYCCPYKVPVRVE